MSSSEQAPEPTMDEILASIRKIISDDETGGDAQPEVAVAESAAAEPAVPAGDGLADELANALADAQGAEAQAAVEPPDDILDLTQVVTEQPPADVSPELAVQEAAPYEAAPYEAELQEAAAPVAEDVQPDAAPAMPEADMTAAAPVAPDVLAEIEAPVAPEAPESSAGASDITALLAEAGVQEMNDVAEAAPQEAAAPAGDDLNAAIVQDDTAVPDPVLVEETSISDALSALDQPEADAAPDQDVLSQDVSSQDASFDADLVMSPEPAPVPDELSEAMAPEAPEAEAAAEVETAMELDVQMPELGAEESPAQTQIEDALPEPEALVVDEPVEAAAALAGAMEDLAPAEDILADSETTVEAETEIEAEAIVEAEAEIEAEAIVEAEAADEVEAADDIVEAAASLDADVEAPTAEAPTAEAPTAEEPEADEPAVEAAAGETRTLEDSVKDLLRPMLREWLDDNMERIVQDEVASAKPEDSDS